MKLSISLDVFSRKRLLFSIAVYSFYTAILFFSYLAAVLITFVFVSDRTLNLLLFVNAFPLIAMVKFFIFNFFNFKRFALYSDEFYDIFKTFILITVSVVVVFFLQSYISILSAIPSQVLVIDGLISLFGIILFNSGFRYFYHKRDFLLSHLFHRDDVDNHLRRVFIVGAGTTGQSLHKALSRQKDSKFHIVGFVDDNPELIGKQIQGLKIYGPIDALDSLAGKLDIQQLIIAMPSASPKRIRGIINSVKETRIAVSTVPSYMEIIGGNVKIDNIREIMIEDLLNREKIETDMDMISREIVGKTVLVTGAAGSIGSEICRQILQFNPAVMILLDQAETPIFYLERELRALCPNVKIIPVVADITNGHRLISIFKEYRPSMVLHAAAYKHVPMMEENFEEAITNNVLGTKNVADIAHLFQTNLFVMISTDKAVNPSSIMGLTKRIAEIYIQGLNQASITKYLTVRFGNVLDSAGNVVQVFKQQIQQGGPVTVTHPDMTRYFMMTSEAVQLVLQAGFYGNGGEIYLLDMGEPVKIVDLANTMIKISGYEVGKDIEVIFTGLRPGEKLFEELRYDSENLMKTPHPKIFVWKSRPHDWETIRSKVKEIVESVYNFDRQEITNEIIRSLVPEFTNGNIVSVNKRYEFLAQK